MTPRLTPSTANPSRPKTGPRVRYRVRSGVLCAIAAIAVHGGLLALTLPESTQPPPAQPEADLPQPDQVPIAVLPRPVEPVEPVEAEVTPTAPPEADPIREPVGSPQPGTVPQVASTPQPRVEPAPVSPPPAASPAPPPVAQTATPPTSAETPPPTTPDPLPAPPPPGRHANFPHLEGAEANCGEVGDCWRSPVRVSWRSAANTLREQLESQGYTVTNVTGDVLAIDTGVRVYEVRKSGEDPYYLHVISVGDGLVYTMQDEPMSADQVVRLQQS